MVQCIISEDMSPSKTRSQKQHTRFTLERIKNFLLITASLLVLIFLCVFAFVWQFSINMARATSNTIVDTPNTLYYLRYLCSVNAQLVSQNARHTRQRQWAERINKSTVIREKHREVVVLAKHDNRPCQARSVYPNETCTFRTCCAMRAKVAEQCHLVCQRKNIPVVSLNPLRVYN